MIIAGESYIFDGFIGSQRLLEAQINANMVFPKQMRIWLERHPPAPVPAKPVKRRVTIAKPPKSRAWENKSKASPAFTARVFEHVARRTGMTVADILGRPRAARYVKARRRAILLLRRRGYSYSEIGRAMERDHSTIIHYLSKKAIV
jgi:hypothetical protein